MKAAGEKAVREAVKEFLAACPEVKRLRWTQYTPYFNDGEECIFDVHGVYVDIGKPDEGEDGWLCEYNLPKGDPVRTMLAAFESAIAGMKDSSGDWNNTKAFLDAYAKAGFDVFAGAETFLLANMRGGGAGCISATANVNPGAIARLFDTWQRPDADAQQARLDEIRRVFARFPMIPALKAAIAHHGRDAAWATVRPPLVALTPEQVQLLVAWDALGDVTLAMRPFGDDQPFLLEDVRIPVTGE